MSKCQWYIRELNEYECIAAVFSVINYKLSFAFNICFHFCFYCQEIRVKSREKKNGQQHFYSELVNKGLKTK